MHIYKILGFLSNYVGGLNLASSVVQMFSKQSDHTETVVEELRRTCSEFFVSHNLKSDLTIENNDSDIFVVKSQIICDEIAKKFNPIDHWGTNYIFFNEELFDHVKFLKQFDKSQKGNKQKLAFLKTALINHKVDNKYVFYNEYDKAILVHKILSTFPNEDCILKMESYFNIPNIVKIELINPDE